MTTLDTRIPSAVRDGYTLVPPAADDDRPADPLKPTLVSYHVPIEKAADAHRVSRIAEPAEDDGNIFHAGQLVPPGYYQEVDGTRLVELRESEVLPASNSGRRTFYRRIERSWLNVLNSLRSPTPAPQPL